MISILLFREDLTRQVLVYRWNILLICRDKIIENTCLFSTYVHQLIYLYMQKAVDTQQPMYLTILR